MPEKACGRRRRSANNSRIAYNFALSRVGGAPDPQRVEHDATLVPVDRTPVVGIDQGEIPQLVTLVEVGYAGRGEAQHDLPERDAFTGERDVGDERFEPFEERGMRQSPRANASTPASQSSFGEVQLVVRLASRMAFTRYCSNRSQVIGHAPTRVW